MDFRCVIPSIELSRFDSSQVFVYADPPYLATTDNYQNGGFSEQDTTDLFDLLVNCGYNFAISEYCNNFVLNLAAERGLFVTEVIARRNLTSKIRTTEMLITNDRPNTGLF